MNIEKEKMQEIWAQNSLGGLSTLLIPVVGLAVGTGITTGSLMVALAMGVAGGVGAVTATRFIAEKASGFIRGVLGQKTHDAKIHAERDGLNVAWGGAIGAFANIGLSAASLVPSAHALAGAAAFGGLGGAAVGALVMVVAEGFRAALSEKTALSERLKTKRNEENTNAGRAGLLI